MTNSKATNQTASDLDLLALKKVATTGAYWTILNFCLSQVLRFGSNLILTRLLFPDLFGLMSMVNVIILGLGLFSDIGIGTSIIRTKRDDPDFLNSAWTLQVIRGFGIWVVATVIAYPVAQFYNAPDLIWLIPVIAFNSVISGFGSTGLFVSYRQMAVKKLFLMELATQIISLVIMTSWAWISPSIWALVAGTFFYQLVHTIWSHFLVTGQSNRFCWEKTAANEVMYFGKWVFLSTALCFLAGQTDRIILGKIFSLELLGIYAIALTLSDVPRQMVGALCGKIIFPTLSRLVFLPRPEFRYHLLKTRKRILMLLALCLVILASFGDLLILFFYDKRYVQAAWMLPVLVIGVWFSVLSQTMDQALNAIGKLSYAAMGHFLRFLYNLISIPLSYSYYGVPGAIIAVALNDLPYYFAIAFAVFREGLSSICQDIYLTLLFIGLLSGLIYVRCLMGFGLPITGMW